MSEDHPPYQREILCELCGNKLNAKEVEALRELERLFPDLKRGGLICEKCQEKQ